MKRYPHYGEQGFYVEYWNLCETPRTAAEARRQLCTLIEIRMYKARNSVFASRHISKRHKRLLKQYWAFRAMEG